MDGLFTDHESCHVCGCSKEQYYVLKHRVEESKQRITLMESEFLQSTLYTENELEETRDELRLLQQKYNALEKSHQELHEVNQDLEERILDIAASYEKEKQALNREVLTLSQKLLDTRFEINKMEEKNQRFKKDCELAVQLLQCTPSGAYQQHKVSTLPNDLQYYVHQIMAESSHGSAQGGINSSNSATSPKRANSKQPLLGSSDHQSNSQYGLLASRIYDSVPANVVARAMQRRDEAERKEMEKLLTLTSRRRKVGNNGVVLMHDKGVQTIYPYLADKKYDLLCVKCGVNMKDVTIDEKVEEPEEVELIQIDSGHKEEEAFNLLDLSDTTAVKTPVSKETDTATLLLDFLDLPGLMDNGPEVEKPVTTPGQSLAELLYGDVGENKHDEDAASNTASSQGSATPGDSGVFEDVSPVSLVAPQPQDSGSSSEDMTSQPDVDPILNNHSEREEIRKPTSLPLPSAKVQEDQYGTEDFPPSKPNPSKPNPPKSNSVKPTSQPPGKSSMNATRKSATASSNPNQMRKQGGRAPPRQHPPPRNPSNKPLGTKSKSPLSPDGSSQLRPGKPEAKVSPVTKTVEPKTSPAQPNKKIENIDNQSQKPKPDDIPKATQVKSQGQHYMQTSV